MVDVSVIIPLYNKVSTILRCIESVFGQSHKSFEVIVVDDGSTDDSLSVLETCSYDLTIIRQKNLGVSAARNTGLSYCSGDFVAFLDADDYWEQEFLATCVDFLNHNLDAVAVSTAAMAIGWDGVRSSIPKDMDSAVMMSCDQPVVLNNFFEFWAHHDHVRTGSVVIRREIIQKAGGMQADFKIAEDLEYWGLIATYGPWGFIPNKLFVTDGTSAAVSEGWLKKLCKRGQNCPSVEVWQERILPRLKDDDLNSFKIVRGRIALNFAYIKLLAGLSVDARSIVQTYGQNFPNNRMALLLSRCASSFPFWRLCCVTLLLREIFKGFYLRIRFIKACQ